MKQSEIKTAARKATARRKETAKLRFICEGKTDHVEIPLAEFRAIEAIAKAKGITTEKAVLGALELHVCEAEVIRRLRAYRQAGLVDESVRGAEENFDLALEKLMAAIDVYAHKEEVAHV